MKPLYSGHPWNVANWLLYKGGLIILCTFKREVLFGILLGFLLGAWLIQVCDMAALDRFSCTSCSINALIVYVLGMHNTLDVTN